MRDFSIERVKNDAQYMQFVKRLKVGEHRVGGLRRRAILGMLYRAWQESGLPSITGVEVGVKHGTMSAQVLRHCPFVEKLILVDPWQEYPADHTDRGRYGYAGRDQGSWDQTYRRAMANIEPWKDRAEVLRETSVGAAMRLFRDQRQVFFAYIDGDHSPEAVYIDCKIWWPNVLPEGILCGDDYFPPGHNRRPSGERVSKAIERFAEEQGLPITDLHRNFFIAKPAR